MTNGYTADVQTQKLAEPVHLTLTRNSKGYGWEVSVHAATLEQAFSQLEQADAQIKAKYGGLTE